MGNYIGTRDPADTTHQRGTYRGDRIGGNGSAGVFIALLVAAYVLDQRPEMLRAAGWLDQPRPRERGGAWPDPIPFRGKGQILAAVQALVDFNYGDEQGATLTAVDLNGFRVQRGMKLKPPTDPVLADLGVMYARYYDTSVTVPLEPERVERIAELVDAALHRLERSSWYDQMVRLCDVFTYAAEHGYPVTVG